MLLSTLIENPPRDASLMPFWFWNDDLDATDILRQIADFEAHGVFGFVIHPRVGLPRTIGWMSDALLDLMGVAIREATRRDMRVILYDEGMYPSGSSSGQVVARDPTLACRCLALHDPTQPRPTDAKTIRRFARDGRAMEIVDRPADAYIRGLHYRDDGTDDGTEDEPAAADLLNPRTATAVLSLVYDRFFDRFGEAFGTTIIGIFTDEPNPLGKCRERDVFPGTTGILDELRRLTGRDFTDDLPGLWSTSGDRVRADYAAAIRARLEETWYAPLSAWCAQLGVALMGHPDAGDEIGVQRHFHVPGQDLVWRFVEPGKPSALAGPESTQAKCTSSAKLHHGRRRNSNEFAGAYGPQTTFDEVRWLARWCLVRGVDLLIPHAFYHSVRGPRRDERPPQLGPHTRSWDDGSFRRFAEECRRLCALNVAGTHVCDLAILTHGDRCPWRAAKVCFEHQHDFNYLEPRTLLDDATTVDADAIAVGPMRYPLLILDGDDELDPRVLANLRPLMDAGRVVRFDGDADALRAAIGACCTPDVQLDPPTHDVRVRHLRFEDGNAYLFFNEGSTSLENVRLQIGQSGGATWLDPATNHPWPATSMLTLLPWEMRVLVIRHASDAKLCRADGSCDVREREVRS